MEERDTSKPGNLYNDVVVTRIQVVTTGTMDDFPQTLEKACEPYYTLVLGRSSEYLIWGCRIEGLLPSPVFTALEDALHSHQILHYTARTSGRK